MTKDDLIAEMINDYVESPTFPYSAGGSSAKVLQSGVLKNGMPYEIFITINTIQSDFYSIKFPQDE